MILRDQTFPNESNRRRDVKPFILVPPPLSPPPSIDPTPSIVNQTLSEAANFCLLLHTPVLR